MLHYNQINISQVKDFNKTSDSHEFRICHCNYYFNKRSSFQPFVWDGNIIYWKKS